MIDRAKLIAKNVTRYCLLCNRRLPKTHPKHSPYCNRCIAAHSFNGPCPTCKGAYHLDHCDNSIWTGFGQ